MTWQEIGDRVFRRRYEQLDQNIGVIVGSDSVCVIDSRSTHPHADELRAELTTLTRLPVRWLVNTHMHWDHTFGNSRFPEATIVGHALCRRRLVEDGEAMRSRLLSEDWVPAEMRSSFQSVAIVPPEVTFEDSLTIHLDDRPLTLRHPGRGHTDNDVALWVEEVCFVGDLVEEGAPPAFGDSHPDEWITTLDRLIPSLPATVVPGHGDVVDANFVRDQRDDIARAVQHLRHGTGEAPWPDAVMDGIASRLG
jgi:glyoxylase-like metal-dependent hydrolase (beta-lactamase superfamily II)